MYSFYILSHISEFEVIGSTADPDDFSITQSEYSVTFTGSTASDQPITITVSDDTDVEGDEFFTLRLKDPLDPNKKCPSNLGEDYQLHVKIIDDDGEILDTFIPRMSTAMRKRQT